MRGGIAGFILSGRMQAAMVASVTLLFGVLMTPLSLLSAAALGLVALRLGARRAGEVLVVSGVAAALLGALIFRDPAPILSMGLMLWVPILLLALVLRVLGSLALALTCALGLGVGVVLAQYLWMADPEVFWATILRDALLPALRSGAVSDAENAGLVVDLARWMPGALGAAWFVEMALSLFIARFWQAKLFNPGGFAAEFRELRYPRPALWIAVAVLTVAVLRGEPDIWAQVGLVLVVAFLLQGLSVAHGLVKRFQAGPGWLIGLYLVLGLGLPGSLAVISLAGMVDGWLDLRHRGGGRAGRDKSER